LAFETVTSLESSMAVEPRSGSASVSREVLARIHWVTPEEEKKAFDYLASHQDKEYSRVDCLSFVVMEARGIREALTLDGDFKHRFIARPGRKTELRRIRAAYRVSFEKIENA
jgi:predicted nucleic acid-binding protein